MPLKIGAGALVGALLIILAATALPVAAATEDACSLLTSAQISDAVGVPMSTGKYVTPEYKKTCTWTPSGDAKGIRAVTLYLETAQDYDAGKKMMEQTIAMMKATKPEDAAKVQNSTVSGIGDDAFSLTLGTTTGLMVKKGAAAFKVEVYAELNAEKKLEIEKALAREVLPKL